MSEPIDVGKIIEGVGREFDRIRNRPPSDPHITDKLGTAGPAVATMSPPAPSTKTWPEKDKVTLAWLWHNMPASAWGVLFFAASAGFAVASWEPIHALLMRLTRV